MSIEIRQLNIKSNIVQDTPGQAPPSTAGGAGAQLLSDAARSEILAECKTMLADLLSRGRER
ncbi:DUF5908 family protein [Collimonas sp.]|jgi:hypothetical protein|uniref:DUF5908 family protein n=1 Tax=Collimonas sp. TaxID=1963772 RepID=UPI002C356C72|nr:DUF5908 family protein [Collimonas sp.]HWX02306.1 DUF5908 family protein [Collimonas sp.]